eukprot:scaffold53025_cov60-Phaeocystis_antarctica.AAC.6
MRCWARLRRSRIALEGVLDHACKLARGVVLTQHGGTLRRVAENDLKELVELGAVEHAALVGVAHGHQLHDLLVARRRQVDVRAPGSVGRAMDAEQARVGGWGQGKGRGWDQG